MHNGIFRARQLVIFLFFLVSLSLLVLRLAYLQVIRHPFFAAIANEQHTVSMELPAKRGAIFDRNMRVLAVNLNVDSVYVNGREIKYKRKVARLLASALDLDEQYVFERVSRDKLFVWLKRRIPPEEAARVKRLKLKGVGFIKESKRFYPNRDSACHVVGIADIDNRGLEGLELVYDRYLKGENGWLTSTQDARQKLLKSYRDDFLLPRNGLSLVLTIDEVIQSIAERELAAAFKKHHAKGASIIVIDPTNGDILALANLPAFDLNAPAGRPIESIRNRAINDFFEPGSVFKVITASAILEEHAVDVNDTFDCENGEWHVARRVLHDHTPHGVMTFREIIEKSSNIGTLKAASRLGAAKMYQYMRAFGFYEKSGIELPGEVIGMNRPLARWSSVSMYAIPMGQEVTTTVLQLARAIAVVADNGYLVKPRIVKEIINDKGETVKEFPPRATRKVLSPVIAAKVRGILEGVIESGTGKKARIEEYAAGGKTGTAQKVEPGGVYSHERFVASFIGFAPVARPQLAVAVCFDEPRPVYYGGDVAAPVFKNVVDASLKYLNAKGAAYVAP